MRRNNFSIVCGFISLFCLSCTNKKVPQDYTPYVKVDTVRPHGDQGVMQFPGKVKAAEDVNLAFRVSGTILRLHADVGTYVQKGQVVAELDPRDYKVQLSATEAEYKQVKAEAERVMNLYAQNSTTANNNDKAVYGLQQITAKYNNHKNQLADTKLYAPFDGYVQKRLFDEHETVGAGMPVISMICKDTPEVEINIPASSYMNRDQMKSYVCDFDVFPGESFPLTLISVNQKANANQLYTMRLRLNKSDSGKMPAAGMATMVRISTRAESDSEVVVPATALFNENNKTYVYVLSNDVLHKRAVKAGEFQSSGKVVILSGLKIGELVVATGTHCVKDNEHVKPLPVSSSSNVGGLL